MIGFIFSVSAWLVYAFIASGEVVSTRSMGTVDHVVDFIFHPSHFFTPLFQTITNIDYIDFYWRSFVGILGWIDCPLPKWLYVTSSFVLIYAFIASSMNACLLGRRARYAFLLSFLLVILSVFLYYGRHLMMQV